MGTFNDKLTNFNFYRTAIIDNRYFRDVTKDNVKVKGFVLLLKSVCLNNTNRYLSYKPIKNSYNKSELSKLLGIDKGTMVKYINKAIEYGYIQEIKGGLFIKDIYVIPDYYKDNIETFNYHCIYNYCLSQNKMPVDRDEKALRNISCEYFLTDKSYTNELQKGIDRHSLDNGFLPYALLKRIPTLPENVNMSYFVKALINNSTLLNKKDKPKHELIII